MNFTEEEIEIITQIEAVQSILLPHIINCMKNYGAQITQNALDFLSRMINQALKQDVDVDAVD